jgi:class 3 adenylate cyclase
MPLTRNWIPRFLHDQRRAGCFQGNFAAATLYADISGFTALTESLMQQGKEGAEILSEQLNRIFVPLVQTIHAHHGWIATFAGDAFLAIFPWDGDDALLHSAQAALTIRQLFQESHVLQTRSGASALSARLGLALGRVDWSILGQEHSPEHLTYYFKGSAIQNCIRAEQHASVGEIVITQSLLALISDQVDAVAFPGRADFWHLTGKIHESTLPPVPSPEGKGVSI